MVSAKTVSKVSLLELLIAVVTVLVSSTLSDAFVPPPSMANVVNQHELQYNGFSTTNSYIHSVRETSLSASTLPSKSGSGLDVIDSWKLLPDGRIKGVMAGSGDSVLTSPLKNKNGLKEKSTVRTVSGSRYKLGTPASGGSNLPADRLGVPRTTLGVRGTQPLQTNPAAFEGGFMQNFLDNKGRATQPLQSSAENAENGSGRLTPLVGGASAVAIGAAIGTGVISDKGIDLNKVNVDPGQVLKSVKSLDLPDIKSLQAPSIPSGGISLPKFDGLPSVSVPKLPEVDLKLPDVNFPNTPDFKLPEGIKLPDVPSISVPGGEKIKNLGDTASKAVGNALENNGIDLPKSPFAAKKPQMTTYGQGPYQVPMPYLDRQVIEAENQRKAQEAAERAQAAEREEAARIQKIREETEAQVLARQTMQRERESAQRAENEARIKQDADARVRKAEEEASRLRAEIEQARLAAVEKEKATVDETARLKKEAEVAFMKEQAAKEEFTQKLQQAELAKLKEAQDFSAKLAAAEAAAAKGRILEEEAIAKQRLAAEAASRQAVATIEARKASIGAAAARKAGYPSPSMSTYQAWQARQRAAYEAQMASPPGPESVVGAAQSPSSMTGDNLSTYKKWQQSVRAKQIVAESAEPVKAAYITGAPAPVASQLVSGTTSLSETAVALNGDLGYVIAGTAAVVAGITYASESQKIQDELSQAEEMQPTASKSIAPPSTTFAPVKPLPPVVPPKPVVEAKQEVTTSVTMAINAKSVESASVTKAVSPPPPVSATSDSVDEVAKAAPTALSTPGVSNNQGSYLESMSNMLDGNAQLKSSYSPFSNPKQASTNDSLYSAPSTTLPQAEEYEEPLTAEDPIASNTVTNGGSYLESMSGSSGSPKSSYSPFSNPKQASTNDSLYSAPSTTLPQAEEYEEPLTAEDPIASNTVTNGGSYLESMSGSSGSPKSSYSPFSNPKQASTNDSLYSAPSTTLPQAEEYEEPLTAEDPIASNTVTNGGSYLESMSGSGSSLKSSYSPFGTPKIRSNDSLYAPPEAGTDSEEQTEAYGSSYFDSLSGANGDGQAALKASYSPFGSPKVVTNDSLYGPPDTPFVPEEAESSALPINDDTFVDTSSPSFSETAVSSNQDSYMNELSGSSGSNLKKSYSPFGRKPEAVDNNGLYSPDDASGGSLSSLPAFEHDNVVEDEEYRTSGSNYLDELAGSGSVASTAVKRSFSPFATGGNTSKGQASGSDILYKPPVKLPHLSDEAPSAKSSLLFSDDTLPSEEERDSTPVSNYLQRLVIPLGDLSTFKRSFSPFGDGGKTLKGQASGSDNLYEASMKLTRVSDVLPSDVERDTIPVSNYLERLVIPLDGGASAGVKTSFSPFGDGGKTLKGQVSGSGNLYKPPSESSTVSDQLPTDKERDSTPVSNYLERLVIPLGDDASTGGKKSFSPFGDGGKTLKGDASGSGILYKPPAKSIVSDELPSEEERDSTPVSNYLQKLVIPLGGDSSAGGNKSFSPFDDGGKTLEGQESGSGALYEPHIESILSDQLPTDQERDNTPVSNYLERLVIPLNDASTYLKKTFSPFGDGGKTLKGQESGSGTLYKPPTESSIVSKELPSDEERDSTPVANYLQRLVIPLSGASAYLKKSFSPFGDGGKTLKGQESGCDILYKPPAESSMASDELPSDNKERDSIAMADHLDGSMLPRTTIVSATENSPSRTDIPDSTQSSTDGCESMQNELETESVEGEVEIFSRSTEIRPGNDASTYLRSIAGTQVPLKSSYSPFGSFESEKFESSVSDLYATSQSLDCTGPNESSHEGNDFKKQATDKGSPFDDGHESYLETLGGAVPFLKNAFSPFGSYSESNLSEGSISTLYGRPQSLSLDDRSNAIPATVESTYHSEEIVVGTDNDFGPELTTSEIEGGNEFEDHSSISEPTPSTKSSDSSAHGESSPNSNAAYLSTVEGDKIRAAYTEWCASFDREPSDFRFEIFSAHYMAVQKFHEENGTPLMLNEFSDLTEEEYRTIKSEIAEDGIVDHSVEE